MNHYEKINAQDYIIIIIIIIKKRHKHTPFFERSMLQQISKYHDGLT